MAVSLYACPGMFVLENPAIQVTEDQCTQTALAKSVSRTEGHQHQSQPPGSRERELWEIMCS